MKVVGFCMLSWLVGIMFLSLNSCGVEADRSMLVSGMMNIDGGSTMATSRKMKENIDHSSCGGEVTLEDYRPYDPSPSSKASLRPGPIEHGTPLIPYIPNPKPSPPSPSNDDGLPSPPLPSNDDGLP